MSYERFSERALDRIYPITLPDIHWILDSCTGRTFSPELRNTYQLNAPREWYAVYSRPLNDRKVVPPQCLLGMPKQSNDNERFPGEFFLPSERATAREMKSKFGTQPILDRTDIFINFSPCRFSYTNPQKSLLQVTGIGKDSRGFNDYLLTSFGARGELTEIAFAPPPYRNSLKSVVLYGSLPYTKQLFGFCDLTPPPDNLIHTVDTLSANLFTSAALQMKASGTRVIAMDGGGYHGDTYQTPFIDNSYYQTRGWCPHDRREMIVESDLPWQIKSRLIDPSPFEWQARHEGPDVTINRVHTHKGRLKPGGELLKYEKGLCILTVPFCGITQPDPETQSQIDEVQGLINTEKYMDESTRFYIDQDDEFSLFGPLHGRGGFVEQ